MSASGKIARFDGAGRPAAPAFRSGHDRDCSSFSRSGFRNRRHGGFHSLRAPIEPAARLQEYPVHAAGIRLQARIRADPAA